MPRHLIMTVHSHTHPQLVIQTSYNTTTTTGTLLLLLPSPLNRKHCINKDPKFYCKRSHTITKLISSTVSLSLNLNPMGEEEKKPEENKVEEKKTEEPKKEEGEKKEATEEAKKPEKAVEEKKTEESKDGNKDAKEEPAPPPPEIVLKVFMHCEGCARKVRRSLKGFPGVEDVITDCKTHKVVVKGEKADPLKVLERVQRKSHRQVELLSPIPKPPSEEDKKPQEDEKPKPEEKKEEPQVITVVLQVHMHCEACAQEIKRRIERMKGVESAEPDLKNSQVSVKGVFEASNLVDYVYKRTGKQAVIVKQEPEKKEEAKEGKEEEKKGEEGDKDKKASGEGEENKEGEGEAKSAEDGTEESKVIELKKNEYYYNPPRYGMEFYAYPGPAYPPQIFSDENPNACSVM